MDKNRFRGVIIGRMNECGITKQSELADAIHVSQACLSRNLADPDSMSIGTFSRIVEYLNIPDEDIKRAIK